MFGDNAKTRKTTNNQKSDTIDTIIGLGSVFIGNLESEGTIHIEGNIKGDIVTKGDVFIGEKSTVEGNIKARNLFVGGEIRGGACVEGRLELNSVAKLIGSIIVGNLIIEEGAVFKGDCTTTLALEHNTNIED